MRRGSLLELSLSDPLPFQYQPDTTLYVNAYLFVHVFAYLIRGKSDPQHERCGEQMFLEDSVGKLISPLGIKS